VILPRKKHHLLTMNCWVGFGKEKKEEGKSSLNADLIT
jgi:hypothetical protein